MTTKQLLKSPSLITGLILCCGIVFFRFVYPPVAILSWDVFGYYLYLPAQFIYHDLKINDLSWVNMIMEKYQPTETLYQLYKVQEVNWVIKESIGLAVLNAPAFFLAHLYAMVSGFATDGFSLPYQYGFAISGLVYACLGVFMFRKVLLEFFNEITSSILLILIVLGTNHFQLTAFDGMLSHNYTFTLYAFILWFTIRWHQEPKMWYAAGLGLSIGLAILCRPSELVCIIIPLFWKIYDLESLRNKWNQVILHWKHLLILIFMVFIGGLPQLAYWKYLTGDWIYYTYQNPGEGLDLLAPYTWKFLFSFRKGWFIYTPIMIFAIIGMIGLNKRQKAAFFPVLIYFLINLWVVSSWTAWWYGGGSYSQRAMLPAYVLLALPLGYFMQWLWKQKAFIRWTGVGMISLLLLLNLFQTWQWAHGIIDRTRMTKAYYFATFGKTQATPEDRKLLMIDKLAPEIIPDDKSGLRYKKLFSDDFENAQQQGLTMSDTAFSGKYSLRMTTASPFAGGFTIPYQEITQQDYAWIRVSIRVFPIQPLEEPSASLVASFEHQGGVYKYQAESIGKTEYKVLTGQWNLVSFDYLTPDIRSKEDLLKVYFWLQGKNPMLIDDFTVEAWEPIE
ncbi:MAG: hypothetical protein IPH84_19945 [Bacteroidales bacterium]|nr:hypothetical protein [Bacteroidales bacterium]